MKIDPKSSWAQVAAIAVLAVATAAVWAVSTLAPLATLTPIDLLVALVAIAATAIGGGLSASWLTSMIRVWWFFPGLVEEARKPWACNICMSAWASVMAIGALVAATGSPWLFLAVPPSAGIALYLLNALPAHTGLGDFKADDEEYHA
jgi:hypothetical protein